MAYIEGEGRNQGTAAKTCRRTSLRDHQYRIFGHSRLLLRGRIGAHTELGLAVIAYNLKRMANVLGNAKLTQALQKTDRC